MATTVDFGSECKEAFEHHVGTLSRIDLNEPASRGTNLKRRRAVLSCVDKVLDEYLLWREIQGL